MEPLHEERPRIEHTELVSEDADSTCKFLANVFGFEFSDLAGPSGPYYTFSTGNGGGGVRPVAEGELGASVTPYVSVRDLNNTLAKAKSHGATVMVPRQSAPDMGWFAWLKIPGGCVIALWQDDPNAP